MKKPSASLRSRLTAVFSPARKKPLAIAVALLAAGGLFFGGPTLFLNIFLATLNAPEKGFTVTCDRARAGVMFRSLTVEGLRAVLRTPDRALELAVGSARLKDPSFLTLWRLSRDPRAPRAAARFLAREGEARDLSFNAPGLALTIERLSGRELTLAPSEKPWTPLLFDRLEARETDFKSPGAAASVSRLEARQLEPEILGGLTLRGLEMTASAPQEEEPAFALRVDGLTMGGLKNDHVIRALTTESPISPLLVLAGCDTLELARAEVSRRGRRAELASARFDFREAAGPGELNYSREFAFTLEPAVLAADPGAPFWRDLELVVGSRVDGRVALNWDYRPEGTVAVNSARLELARLAEVELSGEISGIGSVRPHLSPYQLLFGSASWRLKRLGLVFRDQGLAAEVYRRLGASVFRDPYGSAAENILDRWVRPLAAELEGEAGFSNLPAIVSEIEAFLDQPRQFQITAAPDPPLSVQDLLNPLVALASPAASLVNQDKYDIIDRLRLTLAVNRRAPVAVAVVSGVFPEKLPPSPRPMENLFQEKKLFEEEDL